MTNGWGEMNKIIRSDTFSIPPKLINRCILSLRCCASNKGKTMLEEPSLDSEEAEKPELQDRADEGDIPQRIESFFSPHDLAFRRHRGGFMIISVFAIFFSLLLFFADL